MKTSTTLRKQHLNLHQHVVERLGLQIVGDKVKADEVLPVEAELADSFGVSRTVMREAVKVLVDKRLLEVRTRTGTRVLPSSQWNHLDPDVLRWRFSAGMTLKLLTDIVELRRLIEPAAAELAAKRGTPADMHKITQALQAMTTATEMDVHIAADLDFHASIFEATGNDLYRGLRYSMAGAWDPSMRLSTQSKAHADSTYALHKDLADAIIARKPALARAATNRLIDRWESDGLRIFSEASKKSGARAKQKIAAEQARTDPAEAGVNT